jgi:hypothetical protein
LIRICDTSWKILVYIKGAVKNTKNIDLVASLNRIRYPVVSIEKNANITLRFSAILATNVRKMRQYSNFIVDAHDYSFSRGRIVRSDVAMDFP